MAKQKMTKKQQEARIKAAEQREAREKAAREHREKMRRIGVIIVCVILVLALGLPTVALSVLGAAA